MRLLLLLLIVLFAGAFSSNAQSSVSLTLRHTIPLPGVSGKFDNFAMDGAGERLFAATTGDHFVEVIDLKTDKVVRRIGGLGKLRVYAWDPLALSGTIKLSDDADGMVYNEADHLLFVGHGGSDAANPAKVAVVDTAHFSLVANLATAAEAKSALFVPSAKALNVDIPSTDGHAAEIHVYATSVSLEKR